MNRNYYPNFAGLMRRRPQACARVYGSADYPDIFGIVRFYGTNCGVLTVAEFQGLPLASNECSSPVFGFHIHEGRECSGNQSDRFANTGTHYNPDNCPHPYHAGDMPPLFGAFGYAFSAFLSDRFTVDEIIGRTVVVHANPDDFTTQPSGNSGEKIACGVICRQ